MITTRHHLPVFFLFYSLFLLTALPTVRADIACPQNDKTGASLMKSDSINGGIACTYKDGGICQYSNQNGSLVSDSDSKQESCPPMAVGEERESHKDAPSTTKAPQTPPPPPTMTGSQSIVSNISSLISTSLSLSLINSRSSSAGATTASASRSTSGSEPRQGSGSAPTSTPTPTPTPTSTPTAAPTPVVVTTTPTITIVLTSSMFLSPAASLGTAGVNGAHARAGGGAGLSGVALLVVGMML